MMNFSEKIYRFLLKAYPSDYRARYAEPMEQLFRDRLRQANTFVDLAALCGHTSADWLVSVPARHWERFTRHINSPMAPVRRCLFFAYYEASSFSSREITVEHLLLGILREQPVLVPAPAHQTIKRAIESNEPARRRVPTVQKGDLRLSEAATRVVAAATEIAHTAERPKIAPADLAAAIMRETDTLAARLLCEHLADPT